MGSSVDFETFLAQFFALFAGKSFRGGDYLEYLRRPDDERGGDEAAIVDMAIVSPLLGILGFEPAERVYNQQHASSRPDFAPADALYGTCFIVEDKRTSETLSFDWQNPDSHLAQLLSYVPLTKARFGWLTNGRQFTLWRFDAGQEPVCILDFDIPSAIQEWRRSTPPTLPPVTEKALHDVYDLCRKERFTDPRALEQDIATPLEDWLARALPLGTVDGHERDLVVSLQSLVRELQRDAHRTLDHHLTRYDTYTDSVMRVSNENITFAAPHFKELRDRIGSHLKSFQPVWNLEADDFQAIERILVGLERDAAIFASPKEVLQRILDILNIARQRKLPTKGKTIRPLTNLDEFTAINEPLQNYITTCLGWRQRQAVLHHDYRRDIDVYNDYVAWKSLVQETMLGELDEQKRRAEFALQAAYVVFIRLLLIRVCEDKGVFAYRFLSDGGLQHWQEDIQRYLTFARGNRYSPLLSMAYENAQNVYAHFFTGRELFNWYQLNEERFILTLYQLGRFNFAQVDSDIIGTIYNTYVNREEKRNKGQYYTPTEIIDYILDEVGYRGTNVIGANKRLIDPSCGSGSFLVTAAKRLIAAYKTAQGSAGDSDPIAILNRVQQSLYGFDLNPFACYLAEMNLLIQVLDLVKEANEAGHHTQLDRFNIYNVDALARPSGVYYSMNFLQAEENEQVNNIKSRATHTPYAQGFAFVVANPPYGATLSDSYKRTLRDNWSDVFYGQPDTYTFFLKLGIDLLANNGRLGYITPNTYLMGRDTAKLRNKILISTVVEQIVDLPQGIWDDATVDCVLLFLSAEKSEEKRRNRQVQIYLLAPKDALNKLASQTWSEVLIQQQASWMIAPSNKMNIRATPLLQQIEDACLVPVKESNSLTQVQRLGDVTDSSQGIIPYYTREEGRANAYIRPERDVPPNEPEWKPLLDGSAYIGRYELRWGSKHPYLKYGKWLYTANSPKYFESPKLLLVRLRNKSLKRRLVATFDAGVFFNRDNYNNIIASDSQYDLKYILALFNSSLLNYWYGRMFDNVNINPDMFRQLPIYPADATTQASFVKLVDALLEMHTALNNLRERGYIIRYKRDGGAHIEVPYDWLLTLLQGADAGYPALTFFDANMLGLFRIPERCDRSATISSNIYVPERYPTSLVLRHNKLWFEVASDDVRRYLLGYLKHPRWQGKTWDDIKNVALIPEDAAALATFFETEAREQASIAHILEEIERTDREIDERVLDLYGITNAADRQRVLGSAPLDEDEAENESE